MYAAVCGMVCFATAVFLQAIMGGCCDSVWTPNNSDERAAFQSFLDEWRFLKRFELECGIGTRDFPPLVRKRLIFRHTFAFQKGHLDPRVVVNMQ